MGDKSIIDRINEGLSKYYYFACSRNDYFNEDNQQKGIFKFWCDENGFDEEGVSEELKQEAKQCNLLGDDTFDEEFPFWNSKDLKKAENDEETKNEMIFSVIKKCADDPNAYEDFYAKSFHMAPENWHFDEQQAFEKTRWIYNGQLQTIFDGGIQFDPAIMKLFTIGRLLKENYFQLLLDAFMRARVESHRYGKTLKLTQWINKIDNHHIHEMRKNRNYPKNAVEIIESALTTFTRNIYPTLILSPSGQIADSLMDVTIYIISMIDYIYKIAKESKCPFQADHCILFSPYDMVIDGNFHLRRKDSDNDSDFSDDYAGYDQDYRDDDNDDIGDIKKRLNHENISYTASHFKGTESVSQMFSRRFYKFKNRIISGKYEGAEFNNYPRKKRFVCTIDRRSSERNDDDEIIFFEPPDVCNSIPDNHVAEWYLDASKTCIIPSIGFNEEWKRRYDYGIKARLTIYGFIHECEKLLPHNAVNNIMPEAVIRICCAYYLKYNHFALDEKRGKPKSKTITSTSYCKGTFMVLSFHVESIDAIRVYLHWNGQITRFMPYDLIHVLPKLFVMENYINKNWNDKYVIKMMQDKNIEEKLRDRKYESFCKALYLY